MDAAYDADHLREFIAEDLGAMAHIKRNPTRREERFIDWALYKERHLVEFFQQDQTLPTNSFALRKDRQFIQGLRRPRLHNGLDHLNADAV